MLIIMMMIIVLELAIVLVLETVIVTVIVRPVHLLRVSLLRVLEPNFPGDPPIKFNGYDNSHQM